MAALTQHELREDPQDFIATLLLHNSATPSANVVPFRTVNLLIHGLAKVVLVAALLLNKLWAHPLMIGVLTAFIAYQPYQISLNPTIGLIALTIFAVLIISLIWHDYQRIRTAR